MRTDARGTVMMSSASMALIDRIKTGKGKVARLAHNMLPILFFCKAWFDLLLELVELIFMRIAPPS